MSISSSLLDRAGFRHGFSTRELDLQLNPENAAQLATFAKALGIEPDLVRQAKQVHGTRVLDASVLTKAGLEVDAEADALISVRKLAVGVRVADCVPILVGDLGSGAVLAIHAGWRGLTAGIVERALEVFFATAEGAVPEAALVAIGPRIGLCCFEVGEEVADAVATYTGSRAFENRQAGTKVHVDLLGASRHALERGGIPPSSIDVVSGCTMCASDRFHSFRRDGARSGRHLALIAPRA